MDRQDWAGIIIVNIILVLLSLHFLSITSDNKNDIQDSVEMVAELTDIVTELDQRMDSMEDRPEISISYGTVITTEDEIIIQEEEKDGE